MQWRGLEFFMKSNVNATAITSALKKNTLDLKTKNSKQLSAFQQQAYGQFGGVCLTFLV